MTNQNTMSLKINTQIELKKYFEENEFVYVIYSEYGCKIGISRNPTQRLEQIRQGLPSQKAMFLGLYQGERSSFFEAQLHKRFKNRNISGEWFVLSQRNLDDIDSFLLKNEFIREIKASILWANYLIPSIYLQGNIRIIEVEKELKLRNVSIEFPESLDRIILNPTVDEINSSDIEFLNAPSCVRV